MKHQRYTNFTVTIICLVISALALANTNLNGVVGYAKAAIPFLPQNAEREVEQARPERNHPIELAEIKVKGKAVNFKEKFLEDGEWIKKTDFKLKNKLSKTITYIQVNIDFPETLTSGIMMQQQLSFGRHPFYGEPTDPQPLSLQPNESLAVSLSSEFESIKKMIERRHASINSISKILIRLKDVGFDDGTVYAAGSFFRKNSDPSSPNKSIEIKE
jgi:hypothetical protein